MTVDVSVIIPAYNAAGFLHGCLEGLRAQTLSGSRFEVILINDGSTDDTATEAARLQAAWNLTNLTIITQDNAGPAAARNEGIRRARGKIIALLDSDCIPEPSWLAQLIAPLENNPALVGVEGCTLAATEPVTLLDHVIINPAGGFYWTCNLAYRRDALLSIGGFDEGFPAPCCEDIDIAQRARQLGDIAFAPEAIVRHRVLKRSFIRHVRDARLFSSVIRLHRKHPGLLTPHADFAGVMRFQIGALLRAIVSQRRELFRQPASYALFCLIKLLAALDTLCQTPRYRHEFQEPLLIRQPLDTKTRPTAGMPA